MCTGPWNTVRSLRPVFQNLIRNKSKRIPFPPKPNNDKAKKAENNCKTIAPPQKHKPDMRVIKIYRFDGTNSCGSKPYIQTFRVDVSKIGKMVLDVLIKIKEMDPSLSFRRSCREGICGSCAMMVQGSNCLACIATLPKAKVVTIYPLPHMYVIRDLVVDMDHFIAAYNSVHPYLKRNVNKLGDIQLAQSRRDAQKIDGLYECVLCSCCSTACPSYWWNGRRFLGPAALLHAYRWVIDSRDTATEERLKDLRDDFKLFRCHTIMNCTVDCPKRLNPALAIAKLKLLVSNMKQKESPDLDPKTHESVSPTLIKGLAKYE